MSTRAQSAAAVSRQNSSRGGNSDSDETQTTSSQNSSVGENLTPEGHQISPQGLLPQNFSFITPLIRQPIRSIFDQTEEMSIIIVLIKAKEIASLNESAN
jgi:hypothetical protein